MKFEKNKHAAAMPHCPQNKKNIGIKSEPVIDGVDATVYTVQYNSLVFVLDVCHCIRYIGLVLKLIFRLVLGQCIVL